MTVKQLIRILSEADPDATVSACEIADNQPDLVVENEGTHVRIVQFVVAD